MNKQPGIASAFGAKITLSAPDHGLYLVMGRTAAMLDDLRTVGGQIVMVIPGSLSLLALMPATAFLILKGQPSIAHIGPISIDSARFNQLLARIGLESPE